MEYLFLAGPLHGRRIDMPGERPEFRIEMPRYVEQVDWRMDSMADTYVQIVRENYYLRLYARQIASEFAFRAGVPAQQHWHAFVWEYFPAEAAVGWATEGPPCDCGRYRR